MLMNGSRSVNLVGEQRDDGAGRSAVVSSRLFIYFSGFLLRATLWLASVRLGAPFFVASAAFLRFDAATKSMQHFFLSLFRMLLFAYLMAGHRQNGVEFFFNFVLFFWFFGYFSPGAVAVRR